MTWQICSRSTSPTPTCFRGEIGYHALEVDTGPGSSWVPAEGRLYPVNANLPLFSLFATDFGGDGRVTFGVPDVDDPAPGVHPNVCWSGPFPQLAPPQD
jgi:microcystin-dependent protein